MYGDLNEEERCVKDEILQLSAWNVLFVAMLVTLYRPRMLAFVLSTMNFFLVCVQTAAL